MANLGDETAYDVSVTKGEQVIASTSSVPPYSADRLAWTSGPPCYVNFCVRIRAQQRSLVNATGGTQCEPGDAKREEASGITVRVRWRSASGEWFSQTVHAD